VIDLFDSPWPDLTLDSIERFLQGAEDEPLQWEAKGTRLDPHAVRKAAGAFANSHDGGYLILGAERPDGTWRLGGVEFPEEPAVWVSSTVRDGLRPRPIVDVKSFAVPRGRVAVVWVEPVSDPPCVTRGTVYERVSGQSVPVKDPQRLRDLYARGERAREIAQAQAVRACDVVMARRLGQDQAMTGTVRFSLGLCTTAHREDISSRLFRRSFAETLRAAVRPLLTHGGPFKPNESFEMSQDAIVVGGTDPFHDQTCELRAAWDGSVAFVSDTPGEELASEAVLAEQIARAWELTLRLAQQLGGHGDHYLAVRLTGRQFVVSVNDQRDPGELPLITWGPMSAAAEPSQRERLQREVERIGGRFAFEPEPPEPV
jgi:hypothetical protein